VTLSEKQAKSELVKELRAQQFWTVLRHEDRFTAGIPDLSLTLGDLWPTRCAWVEVKVVKDSGVGARCSWRIKATGLQLETLARLNGCLLVYWDTGTRGSRPFSIYVHQGSWTLVQTGDGHAAVREFLWRRLRWPESLAKQGGLNDHHESR